MALCESCNRVFKDDAALSMHLQHSKVHQDPAMTTPVSTWKCVRCDKDFLSQEELRLHILDSEQHYACMECIENGKWQDFLTNRALQSHIRGKHRLGARQASEKSDETEKNNQKETKKKKNKKGKEKATTAVRETPLDGFFTSFAGFAHDPYVSPEASWRALAEFKGWETKEKSRTAWKRYQRALVKEVEMWFGNETDLTAWRTLCKAVGQVDPPNDIRKCKGILRNTHVNIVDLIAWGRRGGGENEGRKVQVFKTVEDLGKYTRETNKVFAKADLLQYNGGNVVLKHLLRVIFSKGRRLMW
ncbi:hypothetical protein V8C42DRAFT_140582 [Trichoderma barbatum]